VSDVLDFSKIEAGKLEMEFLPFDLRTELDGLLDMFRLRAEEKGLSFAVRYGDEAQGWFVGDAVRIRQVLGNLISNAIKFTAEGEVSARIAVRAAAKRGAIALELEVRDSGIGFDEEFAKRLFQRFSQADGSITRRFGGTGLGLSICQALVEMMDGEISAASAPGEGARFSVTIPLKRLKPPTAHAPPEPPPTTQLERSANDDARAPRVLLAEDHEINQKVIELILGPVGVQLTKVGNGAEALRACEEGEFDLVLMDMQMPLMDGLAATRAIRRMETDRPARRRTPIVMLSANAMRQHKEQAMAAGADLHLAKPITAASLLQAVSQALRSPR
ncbi:MAG: ATP-binding protein, partial [Caulobacteraceae bacterium]